MKTIIQKLKKDILLLDGAFGTYAEALGLNDSHFDGKPGCMEYLNISSPDFVAGIHSDYLGAGSDAVETNTFGANKIKLSEYGLENNVYELNLKSTQLAKRCAKGHSSFFNPKYVIGTMGPTGKLPSSSDPILGNVSYRQIKEVFYEQALGIIDGGADALLIETGQDLLEMKAAANGAIKALKDRRKNLAVIVQCTLANNGRMLLGTEMSAVMTTLGYLGVDVIGLNCSTGPLEMKKIMSFLSEHCPKYISCVPNAGLPVEKDGKTVYSLTQEEMANILAEFVSKYRIDIIGGCCGTTPEYIKAIKKAIKKHRKVTPPVNVFCSSFYNGFNIKKLERPIKVGERINTQGSRKTKDLLKNEDFDSIVEMGKHQQKLDAKILDVCTILTERSTEKRDSVIITKRLSESVDVPLMIDSTNVGVIEAALENYAGTAFINSANLEDGGKKARTIYGLAKEHAGFIVNLTIDEKGMGKTAKRKIEIAEKLYQIATKEFGIEPHRLAFDFLTFTLGTGEKEYATSATDTYKAMEKFKGKTSECSYGAGE